MADKRGKRRPINPTIADIERFAEKFVINKAGCWSWVAATEDKGYGVFSLHSKPVKAHRVSYTVVKGRIPNNLELDHLCRNRSCVNPEHLEVVTSAENTRRGLVPITSGNYQRAKTSCPRGHEYTQENTWFHKDSKSKAGYFRECKKCIKTRNKRNWARRLTYV